MFLLIFEIFVYQYIFMKVFVQVCQLFHLKLLAWTRSCEDPKVFLNWLERAFNLFEEVNSTNGLQYIVHICEISQGLASTGAAFPCVSVSLCECEFVCVLVCVCVCVSLCLCVFV